MANLLRFGVQPSAPTDTRVLVEDETRFDNDLLGLNDVVEGPFLNETFGDFTFRIFAANTINPWPNGQLKYSRLPKIPELLVNFSSSSTPYQTSGS